MIGGARVAWREVRWIVAALSALLTLGLALGRRWLMLGAAGLLVWVCYFFRDPERTPDEHDEALILSPADGRVQSVEIVDAPHLFDGPARRISLFLSLLDVHVQRIPYAGEVSLIDYRPGGFAPAFLASSEGNEANFIGIQTIRGPLLITQMTGILARRIVCWVKPGDQVVKGERLGLIKFGSRVDLYLPQACVALVSVGDQVYGGRTVIARWPAEEDGDDS